MKRIEQLEELPRDMVGDGQRPNVFFVSQQGNCEMITTNWQAAYSYWRGLSRNIETALEDRLTGVICDTCPIEDGSTILKTYDNSYGRTK